MELPGPIVPHPQVALTEIRVMDVWLLLGLGAVWEIFCRLLVIFVKRKPSSLIQKEIALVKLQKITEAKRKLGPSAFVETSKLERQVLAAEKELAEIYEKRKKHAESLERIVLRYGKFGVGLLVFVVYYGVPLITIDELEIPGTVGEFISADTFMKALLFPNSVIGIGARISKWGLPTEIKHSSITGLIVMWSAQVTTGMLMDAVETYLLC